MQHTLQQYMKPTVNLATSVTNGWATLNYDITSRGGRFEPTMEGWD